MNNIISIDLDQYSKEYGLLNGNDLTMFQVQTPCTLTDAVEKFDLIIPSLDVRLVTEKDVEHFKENHLYKEETLEDGIYEGNILDGYTRLWYVKDNKAHYNKGFARYTLLLYYLSIDISIKSPHIPKCRAVTFKGLNVNATHIQIK